MTAAQTEALNARFVADVNIWVKDTKVALLERTQLILLEAFTRVIYRSPVLTGRFRGSWQLGLNEAPTGTPDDDPTGSVTISFVTAKIEELKIGDIGYFFNNQPYARKLEYGYSKKAPNGMVRVTMAEMGAIVSEVSAR